MKLTKIIKLFLILISPYCLFSQSYHTVSFTGNINDFNNDNTERKYVGDNTRYFITFDENYIYAKANRYNGNTFGEYDHFTIYFDTDPQSDVNSSGNGSTSGVTWDSNTPTLPFKADYRVAIRKNGSDSWLHRFNNSTSAWDDQSANYTEWVDDNDLYVRIPLSDLGNPDGIYFAAYMSYNGGFYGADNSGYVTSISGSTVSGYYGGIGLLSSGCQMWATSNTAILGSSTNPTAGGKYASVVLTSQNSTVSNSGGSAFEIISGGKLTIDKASSLTVAGAFTNSGSATMESDSNEFSSLIISGSSITGNVTYNRWVNAIPASEGAAGWDLLGAPMTNGTLTASNLASTTISGTTYYAIQPYDNTDNTWNPTSASGTYTTATGTGYAMAKATAGTVGFTGVPSQKTNVSKALTENKSGGGSGDRWNLIANPFPAYLALNAAAKNASGASVSLLWYNATSVDVLGYTDSEEGIWYWDGDSYETANNSSSAAWAAPGQAFFVSAPSGGSTFSFRSGSVTTQASIVSGGVGDGDDFIENSPMDPDDRAELFIGINQNDISRRTQIYFIEEGTDELDEGSDTRTFPMGDNNTSIYSRLVEGDQGIDMSIQSLAYSEMWDKVIPIGVNAMAGEELNLNVTHKTTPADLKIYLEDTEEGTFTLINNDAFTLVPASDLEGIGRFYIHLTSDTLSDGDVNTSLLNAYKEVDTNYITIEGLATQSTKTEVSLYNILGTKVMDTTLDNNTNTQMISTNGLSTGIYVIKLESGQSQLTKKLIIK